LAGLVYDGGLAACGSASIAQLDLVFHSSLCISTLKFAASSPDSTIIQSINGHRLLSSNGPLHLHGLHWAMARGLLRRRHRRVTRSTNVKQRRRASDSYCLRPTPSILVASVNSRHHSDMPAMALYQLTTETEPTLTSTSSPALC
jgi:hypothetical protein